MGMKGHSDYVFEPGEVLAATRLQHLPMGGGLDGGHTPVLGGGGLVPLGG